MYKYKITNITDHQGVPKQEFFDELNEKHPGLIGEILYPDLIDVFGYLLFGWDDDSGKMLRTSKISEVEETQNGYVITTRNSIYTLEKAGDSNE